MPLHSPKSPTPDPPTQGEPLLIEAVHLGKSFASFQAVEQLTFSVRRGQTMGFVGPNGAGKSTTFRMLAGSLGPSSGSVRIAGFDLLEQPFEAKRLIGYMPESPPLYPEMTAREYLGYRALLKGIRRSGRRQALEKSAERTRIEDVLGTPIGHLSKGYKQRVALSDALLGDPPVLLLDEPTAGLDPNQVLDVRALLRDLGRDRAVLLSTHVLSEVEAVCDTALVIHRGRMIAQGSLAELKARASPGQARLVVRGLEARIEELLTQAGLRVLSTTPEGVDLWSVVVCHGEPAPHDQQARDITERALRALGRSEIGVLEASPVRAALDEVFQLLTAPASEVTR